MEESITSLEKYDWFIKDKLEQLGYEDEKLKVAMYSTAVLAIVGIPLSGYSAALSIGTASLKIKRHIIGKRVKTLEEYTTLNKKVIRVLKEKKDIMQKVIDT
jgi:hypothetical protein